MNLIGRYYYYPPSMETKEAIETAVRRYIERVKTIPQFVHVHPEKFTLDLVTVDGHHIQVVEDKHIHAPNIYWVCEEI